uniref:Ig-like domain-containing protein n=1 Tax=Neolamprologus brichardi TaxID=32507 RepID=A0A3Q4HYA1_NEOBR
MGKHSQLLGLNVTLTCQARKNIQTVEWSRADLRQEYVFLYRDGRKTLVHQHPSFKNRVDLKDKQMKDGDVSLILKNVTINDTGTYECRVVETGTSGLKSLYDTEPIKFVDLRVIMLWGLCQFCYSLLVNELSAENRKHLVPL